MKPGDGVNRSSSCSSSRISEDNIEVEDDNDDDSLAELPVWFDKLTTP